VAKRRIISTHSFRGGTGKSNATANLAVLIARAGFRVGIIDTDIQSPGIHVLFNLGEGSVNRTLDDFLWGRCAIQDAARDVTESAIGDVEEGQKRPRLFLIPSSMDSNEIAKILAEGYDVARLNDGIHDLMGAEQLDLDYLFIDTHPGVNEETLLSIAVSHMLILIMRPDNQDFQGTAVTVELARQLEVPEMCLVLNKAPPESDSRSLRMHVEALYDVPVAGVLPLNAEMVRVASGGIFVNRFPDHPFTAELRRVAERILGLAASSLNR
jgi:MinD-like ATPase involved in chromosome partitioning or flagellar assembly